MTWLWAWCILVYICVLLLHQYSAEISEGNEELRAQIAIEKIDNLTAININELTTATWNYETNITDENLQILLEANAIFSKHDKELWKEVIKFNWQNFSDEFLKRQFRMYAIAGSSVYPKEKLLKYNKVLNDMKAIHSTIKICAYNNRSKCDLALYPDINKIWSTSEDALELKYYWKEVRDNIGTKSKKLFEEYVEYENEIAQLNNFTDNSEYWIERFEDPDFKLSVKKIWEQVKPLYLQFHAYIRNRLRQKYGSIISERAHIPAHFLGSLSGASWINIAKFSLPFPDVMDEDLTGNLKKQNYTKLKIFETAEDFFVSLGLSPMPQLFWNNSIIEKPSDRNIVCHPSAWEFGNAKDFRIKQCTEVTIDYFKTTHHEMGHIEYFLAYKDQPFIFRAGANSGFQEAVGDLITLSVLSRKHLRKLGLCHLEDNPKHILNNLFKVGLDKIAILPFGYIVDLWRWKVFEGKIKPQDYNTKWWELVEKYQGLKPPVNRSEDDFDPSIIYHVVAGVPYIRYFVSNIIQFQFHKALCEKAEEYDPNDPAKPLHECDIYQSKKAGNALKQMMALGSSKPWPDAMEILTGQRAMDASAFLEYFKPLQNWLEEENSRNNVFVGWEQE